MDPAMVRDQEIHAHWDLSALAQNTKIKNQKIKMESLSQNHENRFSFS
jgi:hypothetical protein